MHPIFNSQFYALRNRFLVLYSYLFDVRCVLAYLGLHQPRNLINEMWISACIHYHSVIIIHKL